MMLPPASPFWPYSAWSPTPAPFTPPLAESERSALWPDPLPEQQLGFVCASESMLNLLRITRRVAASTITVLITGETGTGKELLARAVHQCSHAARRGSCRSTARR